MSRTRLAPMLALLILIQGLFVAGCSGAPRDNLSPRELRSGMLRYKLANFDERKYFTGVAWGADLQAATRKAYLEVNRQLTWLPAESKDILEDMYKVNRSATDTEGSVYVLAILDREEAAAHLQRLSEDRRRGLPEELARCAERLEAAEMAAARACLMQEKERLDEVKMLRSSALHLLGDNTPDPVLPEERKYLKLTGHMEEATNLQQSMLVHVQHVVDKKQRGNLNTPLRGLVSAAGLKVVSGDISELHVEQALAGKSAAAAASGRKAGAGHILIGKVEVRFLGPRTGRQSAVATGELKVIETAGGNTVAELNTGDIRGGDTTRELARRNAVARALRLISGELKNTLEILAAVSGQ